MKLSECANEPSVLAALASGSLPDELAAHLNECAGCRDAELVWRFLKSCETSEAATEVAPAEIVWWRAQLANKRVAARRSIAWIDAMQKIALAIAALTAIAIGAGQVPKLVEAPPLVVAGSAAVLVLFLASMLLVMGLDGSRATPRGM